MSVWIWQCFQWVLGFYLLGTLYHCFNHIAFNRFNLKNITKPWGEKLKRTPENGNTSHAYGWAVVILWKLGSLYPFVSILVGQIHLAIYPFLLVFQFILGFQSILLWFSRFY
jgi:hypothetical protein